MPDPRDTVELGGSSRPSAAPPAQAAAPAARPFLRLWFECANQYARAYRSPDGTMYTARCPSCGAPSRFPVGPGGTSERFFRVSCR